MRVAYDIANSGFTLTVPALPPGGWDVRALAHSTVSNIPAAARTVITAAGLPPPCGDPLAHYSPGVDVRIGRPETYR